MCKKKIILTCILTIFTIIFLNGCKNLPNNTSSAPAVTTYSDKLPPDINQPHIVKATGTIEVAFSPDGGAEKAIIKAINAAEKSIKVQAYNFTNHNIAKALLKAKKRGIDVKIILDKSQETDKYSSARFFANNHIPTKIDHQFSIAHSKIIIIDDINIVTGSYNFTKSAETKNAENVLIIRNNPELAQLYVKNWLWRWSQTQNYT
ncbi:phospholipase D family nuclease [Pectinatus sottacetonis]|uniref:phospholipase D family nuclease n=1 Tax=Pectinatus sottacetonis TaxID=1002795 RepID=UPI0018C73662|nr:phospholipase D family protein [Pectinatus sottacetonis]